jgi:hypothetical protein
VVNFTNKELEKPAISILHKGLNFSHTSSQTSNLKETNSGIQQATQHLTKDTTEEICQETCHTLKQSKPNKNISKAEIDALMALWNDMNIVTLLADKGNATMVFADPRLQNQNEGNIK